MTGADNYGFVADLKTGASTSVGCDMRSFDSHTGDFYRATKYIGTAVGVVKFKVDNNGNITANSFVKTNGFSTQYLMADGSVSTMPTLQQVTTAGATSTNPITITSENVTSLVLNALAVSELTIALIANGTVGVQGNGSDVGVEGVGTNIGVQASGATGLYSQGISLEAGVFNLLAGNISNIVTFQKNGITQAFVSHNGDITANSFIKTGGTSSQYLMADGSTKNINLQKVITGNYMLTSVDNDYTIFIDNGSSALNIIVSSGLPTNFSVGFIQEGTGIVSFVASGTTINTANGLKIKGQNYQVFLEKKLATETFYLLGNVTI